MKLFVASDLHCEFFKCAKDVLLKAIPKGIDGVIIAGDLSVEKHLADTIKIICDNTGFMLYVAGNHDYYHSSFPEVQNTLSDCISDIDNLYWLDSYFPSTIDGQKFVGTTLWFEYDENADPMKEYMNDFFLIEDFEKYVYRKNEIALKYLATHADENAVVVTHHLPTTKSIHPKYAKSGLNSFFVSPSAEQIIFKNKPKVWIHGHTHSAFDYVLDQTRVICNPYGYHGDPTDFDWNKIIQL